MAIRYNTKINTSINSIVRNYNAKIRRLEKSAEEFYLPNKTSVKEVKESVRTRRELDKLLKDLQRFSERGMEETVRFSSGVEMSRYNLESLKNKQRIAKIKTSKAINNFKENGIKVYGKKQNTPIQFDSEFKNLKAQRESLDLDIESLTKRQLERLESNIDDIINSYSMEAQYKENWLDMIYKVSYYGNVDPTRRDEIIERLQNLSPANFTRLYRTEKSIKYLQELYQDLVRNKFQSDPKIEADINNFMENFYNNLDVILRDYE